MKKYIWILMMFSLLKGGGLSFWGLDKISTFYYIGEDTLSTPYKDTSCISQLTIAITNVSGDTSTAIFDRLSILFPIYLNVAFFESPSPDSTQVSGPILPVYGDTNSLIEGVIIPDTFSLFHQPGYIWPPPGIDQLFVTDIDRDGINDSVIITTGIGTVIDTELVQVPIGQILSMHLHIEYHGQGKFGNGLSLEHTIFIDRWWTPIGWQQPGHGLIKEEFWQIDSAPGYYILANRSSGKGSSLLENIGIREVNIDKQNFKYTRRSFITDRFTPNKNFYIFDLTGRKNKDFGGRIYFLKDIKDKRILKIILIK